MEETILPKKNNRVMKVDAEFHEAMQLGKEITGLNMTKQTQWIGKELKAKWLEQSFKMKLPRLDVPNLFTKKKMNKKGSIADFIIIVVSLFIIALTSVVMYTAWSDINPELKSAFGDSEDAGRIIDGSTRFINFMDTGFLIVFILSITAVMFFSFSLNLPPAFAIVSILITGFLVLLGAMFSDAYAETTGAGLDTDAFPITNYILERFPFFIALFGTISSGIIYAKGRSIEI